jgi:hypothetical protein
MTTRALRFAIIGGIVSAYLGAATEVVALDRPCMLAGIDFHPPTKRAHDQDLKRLTADVEKAKDDIVTNSEHLSYWWELAAATKVFTSGSTKSESRMSTYL